MASPAATSVKADGRVFALGEPGSWDDTAVGSPVVRCYIGDDEQRWFMWYSGRSANCPAVDVASTSSGSIGIAVSSDGVNWKRGQHEVEGSRGKEAEGDVGSMIPPNKENWWTFDTCHLAPSDVEVLSNSSISSGVGVYWMFYSGGDFEPLAVPEGLPGSQPGAPPLEGLRMRPGLAMSQDGRNWARIEGEHHTGALFDVGEPGEFDELFISSPQLLNVAPRDMRMFYTSWDPRAKRYVVGYAVSPDGFKWTKKGVCFDPVAAAAKDKSSNGNGSEGAFDALGAANINVVRDFDNRQYVMFYEAVAADGSRSIGMAVSKDGFAWSRCPQPLLRPSKEPGAWDSGSVGAPCAVSMTAGKWRLYYCGKRDAKAGPWEGIGMAKSVLVADGGSQFNKMPEQYKRRTPKAAAPAPPPAAASSN